MTQEQNSQNPYANSENTSEVANSYNPYAQKESFQTPVEEMSAKETSTPQFKSTVEQSAAYQAALARQKAEEEEKAAAWTCSCGHVNDGNFCAECGKSQQDSNSVAEGEPAVETVVATAAATTTTAATAAGAMAGAVASVATETSENPTTATQEPVQPTAQATPNNPYSQGYNPYASNNPYTQQGSDQNSWAPQQPTQPFENKQEASNDGERDFSPGSMNFFKSDDPDDMSPGLKWGTRLGWFALGLVAGIFGIMIAWMSSSSLSKKYRRQAMMAAWVGLVVQAALYMILTFTGVQIPFLPQSSTAASSSAAASAGTSGGANAFG